MNNLRPVGYRRRAVLLVNEETIPILINTFSMSFCVLEKNEKLLRPATRKCAFFVRSTQNTRRELFAIRPHAVVGRGTRAAAVITSSFSRAGRRGGLTGSTVKKTASGSRLCIRSCIHRDSRSRLGVFRKREV